MSGIGYLLKGGEKEVETQITEKRVNSKVQRRNSLTRGSFETTNLKRAKDQ